MQSSAERCKYVHIPSTFKWRTWKLEVAQHTTPAVVSAGAAQVLKQKRLYESQREQLYSQQFNMEQTRFTVDSVKDTVSTVQVGSQRPAT
jgi:hypothetical protein